VSGGEGIHGSIVSLELCPGCSRPVNTYSVVDGSIERSGIRVSVPPDVEVALRLSGHVFKGHMYCLSCYQLKAAEHKRSADE
jgi:hypothetical protein